MGSIYSWRDLWLPQMSGMLLLPRPSEGPHLSVEGPAASAVHIREPSLSRSSGSLNGPVSQGAAELSRRTFHVVDIFLRCRLYRSLKFKSYLCGAMMTAHGTCNDKTKVNMLGPAICAHFSKPVLVHLLDWVAVWDFFRTYP